MNNLLNNITECYSEGVFIINFESSEGEKGSIWHNNKLDADEHYEKLTSNTNNKTQYIKVTKDYRYF